MRLRPETDELIQFLNSLIAVDPYAIAELLCIRVPCNRELAEHPTVQVSNGDAAGITYMAPGTFRVGMLGILNGFCGTIDEGPRKGWGPITAIYDEGRLVRFDRTSETPTA